MKILFLSSLDPHDINNWSGTLYNIFHSLKKKHKVHWVGSEVLHNLQQHHLLQNGSQSRFIPEKNAFMIGKACMKIINENPIYDVIFARDYFFIAFLKTDIPIIYIGDTTFNLFKNYLGISSAYFNQLADEIENRAISNADWIVYASEWAKNDAINHYNADPDKIKVIEFGANIDEYYIPEQIIPSDATCCNLLFIGTNWENKGGEKAYEIYCWLKNVGLNTSLTIIGCVPTDLTKNIDPQLRIIPRIDKSKEKDSELLKHIFLSTHFLILPTVFDCFGIVFCEASAYGIPALATDVGGVHQVVRNGKNGYLFPAFAPPKDYVQKILQIWNDPKRFEELRLSSRKEFEERLNWNIWEKKMNNLLYKITQKNKKRKVSPQKNELEFYIPTYVINLPERFDRKRHILKQFGGKDEFDLIFIEACVHKIGAVGLWNSIVKIIKNAMEEDDDVIIICEDDHYFTQNYSYDYLIENLLFAHTQGADILSGGIGGFGYAVPIAKNRYWVDWLWCTQFLVVYKKFFQKILDYDFKDTDTADGVISHLSNNLMTLYPFISRQKTFGYSDITQGNKDNPNLITQHFDQADVRLAAIHGVSTLYNYSDYFTE